MESLQSYESDEPGFWRPGTITAAVVLLLVVLAGGGLIVAHLNGGTNPHPAAGSKPAGLPPVAGGGHTSSPPPAAGGSGCSVPAGSQTVPAVTPQGISWNLYQTVALPTSSTAGPARIEGDVARCYAHSPLGALLAASQIQARYLLAPDWKSVLAAQVVDNPGRATFAAAREKITNTGGNQPGDYNQLAGFKFVTYSPTVAVIEFATKSSTDAMQATTTTVDYVDGDWKLELQHDGGTSPNALPVTSLVGFSIWAGV